MPGDERQRDERQLRQRAREYLERIQNITDVSPITEDFLDGGGWIVTARLKDTGADSWGWYYENGDVQKALFNGEEIAKFISRTTVRRSLGTYVMGTPFLDLAKMIVVALLTIGFSIAVVYLVITKPDNQSLQVLTGLLGLTLGYFVGKVDKPTT